MTVFISLLFLKSNNRLDHLATEKDWDDIKFGVDNQVDFYAVSFVKDAQVIHELKRYLKSKHNTANNICFIRYLY